MLKRLLKIILYALAGFFVLLILTGGLTQTRRFKIWLRDEIVRQTAATINGTLSLGRIEGNLISRFDFYDLCIELARDTLLYVPSFEVGLSPLALLKKQVLVNHLVFHAPILSLRQQPDSAWNVAHLMKPSPSTSKRKHASPWRVAIQNLQVENGTFSFQPLDTSHQLLPRRVHKISTAMRLDYAPNHLNVVLRNLQFKALHPDLTLRSLTAQIFWGSDSLMVRNLKLRSNESQLAGWIAVRHLARPIFEVDLQGAPLHLNELQAFAPSLPVAGPLQGSLHAIGDVQNVRARFHLTHADGLADGNFFVLQDSAAVYYNIEAGVRRLNLTPYLHSDAAATHLNFDFKLEGSGVTLDDLNANFTLNLDSSRVLGRELAQLRLAAQARSQQIQVKLSARSSAGELDLTGKLIDPRGRQIFALDAGGRHFDLAALLQNDTLASDISFRLAGAGENFDPAQLKFDGWLRLFPSRLPAVLIDSAYCQLHTSGTDLQLDTLRVVSSMGTVQAGGRMSLHDENDFRFRAELGDLAWAKRAMEADTLRATGVITGHARGPFDSLTVGGRFEMRQIQYNLTSIKKLTGNLTFNRLRGPAKPGGLIQMKSNEIMAGYLPLDSATAVVHYDLERAQIESKFWQGLNNYGELNGLYTFGEIGRFDVARGMIKAFGQTWQTPADSAMWVEIGNEDYNFHRLILASDNQRLYLDGRLSYVGNEDLQLKIEGMEIASLMALMSNTTSTNGVAGTMDLHLHLTGTAEASILHGRAKWNNGRVGDFAFEKWEGEFGYENENFFWEFALQQNQDRRLTGEGYLPVNLSLNNNGAILYRDRPIRIQAATTNIDLAFLEAFTRKVKQVQGRLACDIKLENTLQQPRSKGVIRIFDGALALPQYGVIYNDLQLAASIDTTFVKVTDFQVQSGKGTLEAEGRLNFAQGAITDARGSLTASDFLVARNRDMELRIDAKISGTGNEQGAEYSGGINVKRSRFFIRSLQPSSVIQLEESTPKKSSADSAQAASPANSMQRWMDNLYGELKINIPRNTWIRGPEFNAEIEGALEFIQEGMEDFSLFGALNIIRGTYELFGKRFDIEGGQITFLGDHQTPQLDLTAKHSFRGGDREKRTIEVKISGSLSSPQIQFLRDGEPVDERDALANLFFGLDFEQLLSGQREDVQAEASKSGALVSAAGGVLSGLVSQQLEKSFGRSLNLDLIQFQGGDNISVVVGKYLTNDVFISLSQEPEARVFSLEWELYKFLFLLLQGAQGEDANKKTGIDFIWKIEW